ncbi:hypothetical protein BJY01DRAFT_255294 [Aspergillus pseudoustus]|uniref:Rhodopsin domain-containing protein n=1 Tax=Aspergillus pseudoustus TaxID=1810923 RepID=A0ABR4IP77_9EURO
MEGRGSIIVNLSIAFLALSWTTIALRLYVRVRLKRSFGTDDCFLIAALLLASASFIILLYEPECHMKKDLTSLTPHQLGDSFKCFFVSQVFYVVATGTVKISFCLTLYRFFIARWEQWLLRFLVFASCTITIFYSFWLAFFCRPTHFFWDRTVNPRGGSCMPIPTFERGIYAHALIILLMDITLAVLPIFIVKGLRMDWKSKASVVGILAIGGIVATVARIAIVPRLTNNATFKGFLDIAADFMIWSMVEVGTSIVAISATALRPLAEKLGIVPSQMRPKSRTPANQNSSEEGLQLNLYANQEAARTNVTLRGG